MTEEVEAPSGRKVELPSGAILEITVGSFEEGKHLYQMVAEECGELKIDGEMEIDANFFKDIFAKGISSKKIESAVHACMRRCTYNNQRIKKVSDIFEPVKARGDYIECQFEVMVDNVAPFMNGLFARLKTRVKEIAPSLQ